MKVFFLICSILLIPLVYKTGTETESGNQFKMAEVWISEPNGSTRLFKTDSVRFDNLNSTIEESNVIIINPATIYQTVDGMGSSLEPATCFNLSMLDKEERIKTLTALVSSNDGIGMNLMRICIGTPDFTGDPWYTYCDLDTGEADPEMKKFSIEKDRKYIIPVLKEALSIYPELRFFASPWSPPGWMKSTESIIGGFLIPEYYEAYALYFVKFIEAYAAEGIPVFAVTIQNEPGVDRAQGSTRWHYPSCHWTAEQERDFIKNHLGPAFKEHGIKTEIWCYDHNFNIKPSTDGSAVFIPEKQGDAGISYPRTILNDPQAAEYIHAIAFHGYVGTPEGMSEIHKEFPEVTVRFTEGSVFGLKGAANLIEILRNYSSSYNAWVTMLDEKRKPNNGPFPASRTIIERNTATNKVTYNFDYYMYGHFMKFIQPGSVRISSEGGGSLSHIALLDPSDRIVLTIVNSGNQDIPLSVSCEGMTVSIKIKKNSIITLRWGK